jgi:glycosyltransferase involved in cell wall biosynthesis
MTMKSPRVAFVDQSGGLGGAELCLLDVARHNCQRCEVILLTDGVFRRSLETAGVIVRLLIVPNNLSTVRRESGFLRLITSLPAAVKLVLQLAAVFRRFDVVYANTQKAFVLGSLAALVSRRRIIWHLHDILSTDHFSRHMIHLLVIIANRLAARVIANSRASAAAFVAAGGNDRIVTVIYNGIDSKPFDCLASADVSSERNLLGLGGFPLIGMFGRVSTWKGQHVAIEALRYLPNDIHLLIVGDSLYGESSYGRLLRQRVDELKLERRVHFLGFRSDIPALMTAVDVVVHCSVSPEPFGRVIVEAMLAGRPVVATVGGGTMEIIEDGVTGLLVPPGDGKALATAVERVLAPNALRGAIVSGARCEALARFSIEGMLAAIDGEIETVFRLRSGH